MCLCAHQPAVEMVNECVDDVPQDEGPGSSQAVLHLPEQQVDKQVVHEEDAVALVAVGRVGRPLAHSQEDPLDGDLQQQQQQKRGGGPRSCRVFRRGRQASVCVTHITHRSPGEDGDQRPVGGAVALAQVVQSRFDYVRGEVRRVGCRIQFPERRRAVITSSPKEDLHCFRQNQRRSFNTRMFFLRASPCEESQVSSITVGPTAFVQSHQQLHHDVCQVVVYQVVDFLRASTQKRCCFKPAEKNKSNITEAAFPFKEN